jgi:hypothetical protein
MVSPDMMAAIFASCCPRREHGERGDHYRDKDDRNVLGGERRRHESRSRAGQHESQCCEPHFLHSPVLILRPNKKNAGGIASPPRPAFNGRPALMADTAITNGKPMVGQQVMEGEAPFTKLEVTPTGVEMAFPT